MIERFNGKIKKNVLRKYLFNDYNFTIRYSIRNNLIYDLQIF